MISPRIKITALALLFASFISLPSGGFAQEDDEGQKGTSEKKGERKAGAKKAPEPNIEVSKSEMEKLVGLHQKIRPIQMKTQKKMMENLKSSELGKQRFTEIRRAQKSGQDPDMTEKEKKAMKALEKKNEKARKEMKGKVKKKVKAEGMKWKRFRKVSQAVQKYPKLRKRYRKQMREATGGKKKMQDPKKKSAPKKDE